jgi:hypothetical protein
MSGPGASLGEMPETPFSGRAAPELDEHVLDAVLAGRHLPPDAPGPVHVVAEMLASLTVPADSGDLAGEAAARRAFSRAASPALPPHHRRRATPRRASPRPAAQRRLSLRRRAPVGTRLAAVLAVASAALGGTAAAYAGVLPRPVQEFAHATIGAPAPHAPARQSRSRRAFRLCTAFQRAETAGDPQALAAARHRLAVAARGTASINAYCAAAGRPGLLPPSPSGGSSSAGTQGKAKGHRNPHPSPTPKGNGNGQGNGNGKGNGKGDGQGNGNGKTKAPANGQGNGNGNGNGQGNGKGNGGG